MRWLALAGVVVSGCLLPSVELVGSFDDDGQGGSAGAGGGTGGVSSSGTTGDAGSDQVAPGGANGEGGAPPVVDGPPQVLSVSPDDMAVDSEPSTVITLTFNEGLDEATLDASSVQVWEGDQQVEGELSYSGVTVTFTPAARLTLLGRFTVQVTTDVTDAAGTPLGQEFTSAFQVREGVWTEEASYLAADATWSEHHAAAADAAGNVLVVWSQTSPPAPQPGVYARWYRPGSGWDETMSLDNVPEACHELTVSVSPAGDAVVAWSQELGAGKYGIYARRYLDGAWKPEPERLDGLLLAGFPYPPKRLQSAASDEQNQLLVTWIAAADDLNGIKTELVQANQANGDGDWRMQQQGIFLGADGDTIMHLALGMTESGKGLLIWSHKAGGSGALSIGSSSYAAAAQTWSSPMPVPGAEPSALNRVALALDAAGDGMVIWTAALQGNADLLASRFTRGSGFEAGVLLDNLTNTPLFTTERAIVSDGKNFVVGWVQGMGGTNANVVARHFDAEQGEWQERELLSDGATIAEYDGPRMAIDRTGNVLAAWAQGLYPADYAVVYARRIGGVWATGQPITSLDELYTGVELVGAPNGVAMALIDLGGREADNSEQQPFFAVFE